MEYDKDMYLFDNDDDFILLKKKNILSEVKKTDVRYDKFTKELKRKWLDGKYYDKVTIEVFGSGETGSKIRNAVTGAKTSYIVGSSKEDLFFKVADATGNKGRKESLILFYDSPEQYENHQFLELDQTIKDSWYKKNLKARKPVE
uniref:Uncharacterized protein n=1 Tax=viral metagenome TaxID=1070528 RepID=A0A6C0KPA1_9ZZZZ